VPVAIFVRTLVSGRWNWEQVGGKRTEQRTSPNNGQRGRVKRKRCEAKKTQMGDSPKEVH